MRPTPYKIFFCIIGLCLGFQAQASSCSDYFIKIFNRTLSPIFHTTHPVIRHIDAGVEVYQRVASAMIRIKNNEISHHYPVPEFREHMLSVIDSVIAVAPRRNRHLLVQVRGRIMQAGETQVSYEWMLQMSDAIMRANGATQNMFTDFGLGLILPMPSNLGIATINRMFVDEIFPIGMTGRPKIVDGITMDPLIFATHDIAHIASYFMLITGKLSDSERIIFRNRQRIILDAIRQQPARERALLEIAYFIQMHERYLPAQSAADVQRIIEIDIDPEGSFFRQVFRRWRINPPILDLRAEARLINGLLSTDNGFNMVRNAFETYQRFINNLYAANEFEELHFQSLAFNHTAQEILSDLSIRLEGQIVESSTILRNSGILLAISALYYTYQNFFVQ